MDGTPLSGSDADFLAYAARYQGMPPATPAAPAAPAAPANPKYDTLSTHEVFSIRFDRAFPVPKPMEFAVSDQKTVRVLGPDYQVYKMTETNPPAPGKSEIEIPAGWKLAEAAFYPGMLYGGVGSLESDRNTQRLLYCKFEKPSETPLIKVIVNEACCLVRAHACVCPAFST
jgi:hypothetical protein